MGDVMGGCLLADRRLHAAYSGGGFGILDIQFDIGWELSAVTVRAQVIGPRYVHPAHCGEHRLGAQLPVVRLMAATTRMIRCSTAGAWNRSSWLRAAAPARCIAERIAVSIASRSSRPVLRRAW